MLNYKLIEVLKTLDKKEMRRLGEFVSSPYFNKNENVIRLFEAVSKYYPDFENRNFTIEKLFNKVFSNEKYDYHKINNVISDLYQITERFLVIYNYENSVTAGDYRILEELRRKKLFNIYKQKYKSFADAADHTEFKDEAYWFHKYRLIADYRMYLFDTAPNTELELMQKEYDHFLSYAIIKILRFYTVMIHEKEQNNIGFDMRMLDEVLSFLEKNTFEEPPLLSVYKNILYLQIKKERKYYDELRTLKDKYMKEFSNEDIQFIYTHIFGFIVHQLMYVGDYSYYRDAFEHYKEQLEIGLYHVNNMTYFDFLNYVKASCSVGEFKWAEDFIEKYKQAIPEEELSNTLNFVYGTIEQKKGNFEKAISYFAKTNFSNFIIKEQVKIIQCRLYFELGMFEQTLSSIDSFRHYLLREKMITEIHKECLFAFLKYLIQLVKIKESVNNESRKFDVDKLRNEINANLQNIFGVKLWMLEKINEIK